MSGAKKSTVTNKKPGSEDQNPDFFIVVATAIGKHSVLASDRKLTENACHFIVQ